MTHGCLYTSPTPPFKWSPLSAQKEGKSSPCSHKLSYFVGIHKGLEKHEKIVHKDDGKEEADPEEDEETNPFADDMEEEKEENGEETREDSHRERIPTLQHLEESLLSKLVFKSSVFQCKFFLKSLLTIGGKLLLQSEKTKLVKISYCSDRCIDVVPKVRRYISETMLSCANDVNVGTLRQIEG